MKIFLRLLSYLKPYRRRFALGVFVSFFVAALNGVSLSLFIPFFEALGMGEEKGAYAIQFKARERSLLRKALTLTPYPSSITIPTHPKKLDKELSENILNVLWSKKKSLKNDKKLKQKIVKEELSLLERWELEGIVYSKLKINASAFSPMRVILFVALLVLPCWSLKLFLSLICVRLIARSGYLAVQNIREALYLKVQRLELTWFYRNKSGELVSRLSNDAEIVAAVISDNMRDAIMNFFYFLVHIAILSYLNLDLLVVVLLTVPLLLYPITLFTRKIRKSTSRSQGLLSELHGHFTGIYFWNETDSLYANGKV